MIDQDSAKAACAGFGEGDLGNWAMFECEQGGKIFPTFSSSGSIRNEIQFIAFDKTDAQLAKDGDFQSAQARGSALIRTVNGSDFVRLTVAGVRDLFSSFVDDVRGTARKRTEAA